MNKRCTVCNHPARVEIDRGLLNGVSYRALAAPYGLSPSAICRHLRHLQQLQAHHQAQKAYLEQLELLSIRLDRLYHTARPAATPSTSPAAPSGSPSASSPSTNASATPRPPAPDPSPFLLFPLPPGVV